MKSIQFRAWDKLLKDHLPNIQNHVGNSDTAFGHMLKNDRYVIEQFTGLKDKNGVDIYEGDILKVKNRYGSFNIPVTFYNGYFASDNSKVKQIENPDGWDYPHDKVDSYGFRLSLCNQLMDGYSNISGTMTDVNGKNIEYYDILVSGNIHQNPELLNTNN